MDYQIGDWAVVVYGNEWYPGIVQEVNFQYLCNLSVKYKNTLMLLTVTEFLMIRPFHVFLKQCQTNFQVKDDICKMHGKFVQKNKLPWPARDDINTYNMDDVLLILSKPSIPTNSNRDFKMDALFIKWQTMK